MSPEAASYLEKAREDLEDATKVAAIGLPKLAARCAYYAAFHAAEAFIVEKTGRIAKTHSGVRSELMRLANEMTSVDRSLPKFLAKAYLFKEMSDYAVGPGIMLTPQDADAAIVEARRFIDAISGFLSAAK
ncbi:MAG TPA: HEPN domain-containing protein [Rhodoblastus sp.]|nr:HEPN domain-containing protein [Rhodoblastus sp.]